MGAATTANDGDDGYWSFVTDAQTMAPSVLGAEVDRDAMQLFMTLHRATDLIFYDLRAPIRDARVSETGFSLMFILQIVGTVPIKRLVTLSGMSKASCSAAIRTLVANGHVVRETDPIDGRQTLVRLSPEGLRVVQDLFPRYNLREQEWAASLSPEDRAHLLRILSQLMDKGRTALRRR